MSTRLAGLTQFREWQRPQFTVKVKNATKGPGIGAREFAIDRAIDAAIYNVKPLAATVPTDELFRKCSHCNGPLPPIEPMTLERAVAVLNEHRHGDNDWEIISGEAHSTFGGDALSEFEAIAIAEKLERER